jgi:hypothetical protein
LLEKHWRVSESRMCIVNQVSESHFISLLAGFFLPEITVKTLSASSAAY